MPNTYIINSTQEFWAIKEEWGSFEDDDGNVISNTTELILDQHLGTQGRWSSDHELVFKHNGKFFRCYYEEPLTELQQGGIKPIRPPVTCPEVEPVKITITKYQEVK